MPADEGTGCQPAVTRRRLLALGSSVAIAGTGGCLWSFSGGCTSTATFNMREVTAADLSEYAAQPLTEPQLGPVEQILVQRAMDVGNTTYTAAASVDDGIYRRENTYYRISSTVDETTTVPGYQVTVDLNYRPSGTATDEAIPFSDLPAVDQQALRESVLSTIVARQGRENRPLDEGSAAVILPYPTETARADSVLAQDPQSASVLYDGTLVRLTVLQARANVTHKTVSIESSRLATSQAEFSTYLKQNRFGGGVTLDSLSNAQRDILDTAITAEHGYHQCLDERPTPAFESLIQRIYELNEGLGRRHSVDDQLVIYQGKQYLASYHISVA